jgi:hypothetical protein
METITRANGAVLFKNLHDEDTAIEMSKLLPACLAYIDCRIFFASRYEGEGSLKVDVSSLSASISGRTLSKKILNALTVKITDTLCLAGYRVEQTGYVFKVIWMRPADPGC